MESVLLLIFLLEEKNEERKVFPHKQEAAAPFSFHSRKQRKKLVRSESCLDYARRTP